MTAETTPGDCFTRGPNWTYDLMPVTSPAEYKVLSAAVRLTYGWNEEWTEASAHDIAELTGIARPTVTSILNLFAAVGLVEREPGTRNGYRWRLSFMTPADLSAKMTGHKTTCQQRLQPPVSSDDNYLSAKMTTYIRKKERLKTGKKESGADAPATPPVGNEPPDRPARNPQPPVAPAPLPPLATATPTRADVRQAPAEAEQVRLVDAAMADPVAIYREYAGVKKPKQAQRAAILAAVTAYADEWQAVCERFARNDWNVRNVDNLLDAYRKAVGERRKADARAAETERQRAAEQQRQAEAEEITPEERRAILGRFREWRTRAPATTSAA